MTSRRDDFVYKHRIEEGLCPYCGTQVRLIQVEPRTKIRRSEPLTVPGIVLVGRVLFPPCVVVVVIALLSRRADVLLCLI